MSKNNFSEKVELPTAVSFIPNGETIAVGFDSGSIRLSNISSKKEMISLQGHKDSITCLSFSIDGKTLTSGSKDRRIIIWDVFSGKILKVLKGFDGRWGIITSLAINTENDLLATATTDNKIRVWDIKKSWKKIQELKGHKNRISKISFLSPKELVSVSWDRKILLWDLNKGKKISELKGHFDIISDFCFCCEGKKIVTSSSDGTIKEWDLENNLEIKTIAAINSAFTTINCHLNNRLIASGANDNLIRIYDHKTNKELAILPKHASPIIKVLFSPNGKLLLTLSDDGEMNFWNIDEIIQDKTILSRAKEAFTRENVKGFLINLWDKSLGKIIPPSATEKDAIQKNVKNKLLAELPDLISLLNHNEELKVAIIQERYKCSRQLAEEVIMQLLKEEKISGLFNPFSGVFTVYKEIKEIVREEKVDSKLAITCFYCGEPITDTMVKCPSCQKELVKCPVCKLNINFDSVVGVCVYCSNIGHLNHLKEAVKISGQCPVCRKKIDWDTGITNFRIEEK